MEAKQTRLRAVRRAFAALTGICLGFIFYQSSLGPAASSSASNGVRAVVVALLGGPETLFGSFVNNSIRKIAHFLEFFALGASVSLHALSPCRPRVLLGEAGFCLASALADEGLQHFTGRSPALLDVMIDGAGAFFALLLFNLIIFAVLRRRAAKERNCRV